MYGYTVVEFFFEACKSNKSIEGLQPRDEKNRQRGFLYLK